MFSFVATTIIIHVNKSEKCLMGKYPFKMNNNKCGYGRGSSAFIIKSKQVN